MSNPFLLEVAVTEPTERDQKLEAAVRLAMEHAMERRQGILVTQRSYGHYAVSVSPDVPFGQTRERRERPRP